MPAVCEPCMHGKSTRSCIGRWQRGGCWFVRFRELVSTNPTNNVSLAISREYLIPSIALLERVEAACTTDMREHSRMIIWFSAHIDTIWGQRALALEFWWQQRCAVIRVALFEIAHDTD